MEKRATVLCVIPARYASTRLPGKPLKDIQGKPMVVRVYERAKKAQRVADVIVATDDHRIADAVKSHGGKAVMTRVDHPTGTDRLAEVAKQFPDVDVILNVQGDEPLIDPAVIDALASAFDGDADLQMATACTEIRCRDAQDNPNNVKVVMDRKGYALYFSRSLMPYPRKAGGHVFKHIGIYAYRRGFLLAYAKMEPTPLEQAESLEQLRALENGCKIKVIETDHEFVGVDTAEDLAKVNAIYAAMK